MHGVIIHKAQCKAAAMKKKTTVTIAMTTAMNSLPSRALMDKKSNMGKNKDKKAKSKERKQRKKSRSPTNKQDQGRTGKTKSPKNKSSNLSKYLNNSNANLTQ